MTSEEVIKRLREAVWIEQPRRGTSHGQFKHPYKPGKVTVPEHSVDISEPMAKACRHANFSVVTGIPTINREDSERAFYHMDGITHAMGSRPFSILILWDNVPEKSLQAMADNLNNVYEQIVPWIKNSFGNSESNSEPDPKAKSKDVTKGTGKHRDWEEAQKDLQILQKSMDEDLLPRLALAQAKGIFNTAVYLATNTGSDLTLLENLFTAIFQGEKPSRACLVCLPMPAAQKARSVMGSMQICGGIPVKSGNYISLLSKALQNGLTSLSTWLTSQEIAIMARMPVQDVPGLETDRRVAFGVNLPKIPAGQEILLGNVMEDGNTGKEPVNLNREDLERHIFISGTTGSGKTSTCHKILNEFSSGFMVLEPAKTE